MMLGTITLLRNVKVLEQVYTSSANYGKNHNFIFNVENKYLYGALLETRKQRREKIGKTLVVPSSKNTLENNRPTKVSPEEKLDSEDIIGEIPKKGGRKSLKNKTLQEPTTLTSPRPTDTPESKNASVSLPILSKFDKLKNKCLSNKETVRLAYQTFKSISSPSYKRKEKSPEDSVLPVFPDEFVIKSVVLINDFNYPLINPEKNKFDSHDSEVDSVVKIGFNDPAVRKYLAHPSVSKIMEETMSENHKLILANWRKKMIAELGEDGFEKYSEDMKTRGKEFHEAVAQRVLGQDVHSCSEVTRNALHSLSWVLELVSQPIAVESITAHPFLGYKGIPDCIALFKSAPVVIDWKLSDKPKKDLKDTYDAPVQVSAYMGAVNYDPNYKCSVSHGLIAVAYTNGAPCDVFLLAFKHCKVYWKHWLMRLDKYNSHSHLHLDHDIDENALKKV